jgi:transcriptional regulator with XRE-family HTH domain
MAAGLTQRQVARLAGVSQQEVSRAEQGYQRTTLETRCRLAAACGHELGWRLYPAASVSLRDSGQMGLAQAIASVIDERWKVSLEVPVSESDLRAADMVLVSDQSVVQVEIERSLVDFQAQLRAAQVKRESLAARMQREVRLVIAVPDTRTARARLKPYDELLLRSLPVSSRQVWASIRGGKPLSGDGIVYVRPRDLTRRRSTSAPK